VDLYDWKSLTFNGVPALRAEKKRSRLLAREELYAYFDKSKAVQSMTRSKSGEIHPAIVAGRYKTGAPFSGSAVIEIEQTPIRISAVTP
jgi:hypothetical protein